MFKQKLIVIGATQSFHNLFLYSEFPSDAYR
nr:MAG TPA: hypothetical protein [Caudoviricetes sp.]